MKIIFAAEKKNLFFGWPRNYLIDYLLKRFPRIKYLYLLCELLYTPYSSDLVNSREIFGRITEKYEDYVEKNIKIEKIIVITVRLL